jgi:sulfur-oxidizing protein SoxA
MKKLLCEIGAICVLGLSFGGQVQATDPTTQEFETFRAMMEADNPAEIYEDAGAQMWKAKRGPNNVSLEQCDLGLGPGVVKGAYVQMPRYFADAGRVMDAERRIVYCMVSLQGFNEAELAKRPFAADGYTPDPTILVTYVAGQSRNMKIDVSRRQPQVAKAYIDGMAIFNYRAGPYDFSCATCHGEDGKRIRTQELANLTKPGEEPMKAIQGWPAYRMTGGYLLSLQWRLNDCFRQQRLPEPKYGSDTITALLTYLTANANGQVYQGPGIKR